MKYNKLLADALISIAERKGCTPAQLSIAWVSSLDEKVIPLPGSTYVTTIPPDIIASINIHCACMHRKKERTLENLYGGDIELTQAEKGGIASVMEQNPVHGHRYFGEEVDVMLWG